MAGYAAVNNLSDVLQSVTISLPDGAIATAANVSHAPASCAGSTPTSTGSIAIELSTSDGGAIPGSYALDVMDADQAPVAVNGVQNQTISGLTPGFYTVILSTQDGTSPYGRAVTTLVEVVSGETVTARLVLRTIDGGVVTFALSVPGGDYRNWAVSWDSNEINYFSPDPAYPGDLSRGVFARRLEFGDYDFSIYPKPSNPPAIPRDGVTGSFTLSAESLEVPVTLPAPMMVTTTNVNCRTGAGTSFMTLGVVARDTSLLVRGATSNGWTPVFCFSQNGWISNSYLDPVPTPTATATATQTRTATATVPAGSTVVTTTKVNCRSAASTSARIIVVLNKGVRVPVRGAVSNGWTPVVCGGQNGWIASRYLRA